MSISTLQLSAREFTLYNDTLIFQKANLANAQRSLRVEYDAECSSSNQDTVYIPFISCYKNAEYSKVVRGKRE